MKKILISNPNGCPITHSMNVLGNKWTSIIIYTLKDRKLRFGEIAVRIDRISRKVLTEQLKQMERRGLLVREAHRETPPKVEYSLTKKALELIPILNQLCDWSKSIDVTSK